MKGGYGQICPIAMACEVFARPWTPLILRELLAGSYRFNEIHRGVPLISRALLTRRLCELEDAGVVRSVSLPSGRGREYRLTPAGEEFRPMIEQLGAWGQRWTVRVQRRNLDAGFLMWGLHRNIASSRLPPGRTVVRFDFSGVPTGRGPRRFWLLLERRRIDLCMRDPGFEVDLYVETDLATFAKIWLGDVPFARALNAGAVKLSGPRALTRAFPSWLALSGYADVPRPLGAN